ncbi:hypothetical protein HDU98_010347 [Podochytrium sp. JEL0797]|nr:hypothetical protein HDU98_010347 [Podochytrium sp. JEL0797]
MPPPPAKKAPASASLSVKSRAGGSSTTELPGKPSGKGKASSSGRSKRSFVVTMGAGEEEMDQVDGQCLTGDQISELNGLEVEEAYKLGCQDWREDLHHSIMLTYLFGIYQFAKENAFSILQITTFLSIMKITVKRITSEEKGVPPLKSLEKFRALVLTNSGPANGEEVFGPRESKLIIDFAMSGVFQHYKLYQHVMTSVAAEEESTTLFISAEVEEPFVPPPLGEAVTLEAYEAEQSRLKGLEEQARLEKERWEAEERAAAANPFDVLSSDQVKAIATETVGQMLHQIASELDGVLSEQSERLMQQANKLSTSFDYSSAPSSQMAQGYAYDSSSGQAPAPTYSLSAAFSTGKLLTNYQPGDDPNEPPLLDELGINFSHMRGKAISVLNPLTPIDKHIFDDSDLAGPALFCLLYGGFQLFAGKVQFNFIYAAALLGWAGIYSILNLMCPEGDQISSTQTASVLGYCFLPMVLLSSLSILLHLSGTVGLIMSVISVFWCTYSASLMFSTVLSMENQRFLVAYPVSLLYSAFALLVVMSK